MSIIELLAMGTTVAAVWVIWSASRKPKPKPRIWNWPDYYSRELVARQWEPVERHNGPWQVKR